MEVLFERCCGLDVHKRTVVASLLTPGEDGQPRRQRQTFGTTTGELLGMADWLQQAGCTHVAMESTGSYWKPVYNLLEDRFELIVVNTHHLKLVPGRKSDARDADWIADLLRHGLLRPSFIPPRPERELRELTRYRTSLVQERTAEVNRIQKVLEGANIKLAAVASDVVGVSGRAMLQAMVEGEDNPRVLAQLARGQLRDKQEALEAALLGSVGRHQRFLLAQQLRHLAELDAHIAAVTEEISDRQAPFADARERLQTIPGVGRRTAEVLLSEVGCDVSRFPTAGHLASWAGVCPGQRESAGVNRSGKPARGNPALKTALVEAAQAGRRTKTFLGTSHRRLVSRIGPQKAALAIAHSILVIAYNLLKHGTTYEDLGTAYYDVPRKERVAKRLTSRLEQLGYQVSLNPVG
ncbi:MAG: IS110 family transposase [Vicinamibacterales bacterium]